MKQRLRPRACNHTAALLFAIPILAQEIAEQLPASDSEQPVREQTESRDEHLFILSGQSNMRRELVDAFRESVEQSYGKENVIVASYSRNSQPIRMWYKKWHLPEGEEMTEKLQKAFEVHPNGTCYLTLMKSVEKQRRGADFDTATFIWMQGEADAGSGWSEVYAESFKGVLDQLRADLEHKEINFVIGRINDFYLKEKRIAEGAEIRKIQVALAESSPRGAWVNTDDLNTGVNPWGVDEVDGGHMTVEGYPILGQRFAEAAMKLIEKDSSFIDTHCHFHDRNPGDLDRVAEWMQKMNIRRCINHPLRQSRPRNDLEREQMLQNYSKYKGLIERFCIIYPEEVSSVEEAVKILAREKKDGAIGFGEHYGVDMMFDDPANMRLYAACEKVGLPVMFHMDRNKNLDEKGLPRLERVLKTYPELVLIAHSDWWKHLPDGTCERLLQDYPNLYADISCTVRRSRIGTSKELARAFFIRNADKLLFATDSGWWSLGEGKKQQPEFLLIDELNLPREVEDKICRDNATRLFGFNDR